jgi:outer membrane receptor for ferric coprogen and ferric-rhodotorulic acid
VLHVDLALSLNAHGALRGRKVALFKNRIKQNRVMEYQLIKLYQLNQA